MQHKLPSCRKEDISKLQNPANVANFEFRNLVLIRSTIYLLTKNKQAFVFIVTETAKLVINFTKTQNQDCFDTNNTGSL